MKYALFLTTEKLKACLKLGQICKKLESMKKAGLWKHYSPLPAIPFSSIGYSGQRYVQSPLSHPVPLGAILKRRPQNL